MAGMEAPAQPLGILGQSVRSLSSSHQALGSNQAVRSALAIMELRRAQLGGSRAPGEEGRTCRSGSFRLTPTDLGWWSLLCCWWRRWLPALA